MTDEHAAAHGADDQAGEPEQAGEPDAAKNFDVEPQVALAAGDPPNVPDEPDDDSAATTQVVRDESSGELVERTTYPDGRTEDAPHEPTS